MDWSWCSTTLATRISRPHQPAFLHVAVFELSVYKQRDEMLSIATSNSDAAIHVIDVRNKLLRAACLIYNYILKLKARFKYLFNYSYTLTDNNKSLNPEDRLYYLWRS